jgi:hypothetical protein
VTKTDPQVRLARLQRMQDSVAEATATLRDHRRRLLGTVRIRPGFMYKEEPVYGEFSDRRLPPRPQRPPLTRILTPNGAALRLYLLGLFEAQANSAPGMPPLELPLVGSHFKVGWTDLLASSAQAEGRGNVSISVTDKKIRQLHSALTRLAAKTVKLVYLPNAERRVGKYEQFQLLDEGGVQDEGENSAYVVPAPRATIVSLPSNLFLNGWIHTLEDTEIAFLMMIFHQRREKGGLVKISSYDRVGHFGIGPDAYATHRLLQRFGLIDAYRHPDRDEMGRVGNPNNPHSLVLHQFRLLDDGFDEPATKVITEALRSVTVK